MTPDPEKERSIYFFFILGLTLGLIILVCLIIYYLLKPNRSEYKTEESTTYKKVESDIKKNNEAKRSDENIPRKDKDKDSDKDNDRDKDKERFMKKEKSKKIELPDYVLEDPVPTPDLKYSSKLNEKSSHASKEVLVVDTDKFAVSNCKSMEANQQHKSKLIESQPKSKLMENQPKSKLIEKQPKSQLIENQPKSEINPDIINQNILKEQQDQPIIADSMIKCKVSEVKSEADQDKFEYIQLMRSKLKDDSASLALHTKDNPKSTASNVSQHSIKPELTPKDNKFHSGISLMADKQHQIGPILKSTQPEDSIKGNLSSQLKDNFSGFVLDGGHKSLETKNQQDKSKFVGKEESEQKAAAVKEGQIGSNIIDGLGNNPLLGTNNKDKPKDVNT